MLEKKLAENNLLFITWTIIAAFGAYFCTYAFRKPFAAGIFENQYLFGISYKSVLIISQVIGYVLSKFIGVKIVSELKASHRKGLIILLISVAQLALIAFGLVPKKFGFIFLFLNGLPLGMVWGIIYSYLEGRRFTELLAMGLSLNMIVTSGILKTCYKFLQGKFNISEFWMPSFMGFIAFPLFLVFVWMLSKIPPPTPSDVYLKTSRKPMSKKQKRLVLKKYFPGIAFVAISYTFLTGIRDFRDNFIIEIWNQINPEISYTIFAKTESIVGLVVMIAIASLVIIKSNKKAFQVSSVLMLICMLLLGVVTNNFKNNLLDPELWMVLSAVFFYLPYLIIQIAFFDRIIAYLHIKANAGFFVYICDSLGYLGSVAIILYKEFAAAELNYLDYLITYAFVVAILGFLFIALQFLFFTSKDSKVKFSMEY